MEGKSFLKRIGLGRIAPRWLDDRDDLITVGGLKSKSDECWKDTNTDIHESEKVKIIAHVLESAVHVVMNTHVYKFCNKFYLQSEGGPIRLQ